MNDRYFADCPQCHRKVPVQPATSARPTIFALHGTEHVVWDAAKQHWGRPFTRWCALSGRSADAPRPVTNPEINQESAR